MRKKQKIVLSARSCIELQQSQDKAILNYMGEQLTKAKEIIREYLKATECWNYDFADVLKCNKKAEAFLKV